MADWALAEEFLGHFAAEWPVRWAMPAESRACATRLSNVDVAEVMAGWPWAAMERWWGRGTTNVQ